MAGYICLCRFTQQQLTNIKDITEGVAKTREGAEEMGIRIVGIWMTMGEYDCVAVLDAPDDATLSAFILDVAAYGNITTQTMRAFSEEEFAEIVGRLPLS